jgi:hypothetical protein
MSKLMLAITALGLSVSGAAAQTMSAPAGAETAEVGAVEQGSSMVFTLAHPIRVR